MPTSKARALFLAGLVPVLGFSGARYDTGYHQDMTYNAARRADFNDNAARIMLVSNWLPDLFGPYFDKACQARTLPTNVICVLSPRLRDAAVSLHFDNLSSGAELERVWRALYFKTVAALDTAASTGDALQGLVVLGVSLHAVQDFYSHSTWTEPSFGFSSFDAATGHYRVSTWFDRFSTTSATGTVPQSLRTGLWGRQGNPQHDDLNLDHEGRDADLYQVPAWSPARRTSRWDVSYVTAYAASRQWLSMMRQALNDDGFWDRMRNACLTEDAATDLASELEATRDLSVIAGRWKGPYSGPSNVAFLDALARSWFVTGMLHGSTYVAHSAAMGRVLQQIGTGMYSYVAQGTIPVPDAPGAETMISFRTYEATGTTGGATSPWMSGSLTIWDDKGVFEVRHGPVDENHGDARINFRNPSTAQTWHALWSMGLVPTPARLQLRLTSNDHSTSFFLSQITAPTDAGATLHPALELQLNPSTGATQFLADGNTWRDFSGATAFTGRVVDQQVTGTGGPVMLGKPPWAGVKIELNARLLCQPRSPAPCP
jgi:hypothetical protein